MSSCQLLDFNWFSKELYVFSHWKASFFVWIHFGTLQPKRKPRAKWLGCQAPIFGCHVRRDPWWSSVTELALSSIQLNTRVGKIQVSVSLCPVDVCFFFCEFPFFELILLITFATLISVLGFFFELPWFWFLSVWVSLFCLPDITQSKFDIKLYRYTWYATLTWNTKKVIATRIVQPLFRWICSTSVTSETLHPSFLFEICGCFPQDVRLVASSHFKWNVKVVL